MNNRYRAEILRWIDGDTIQLRVDLGQKVLIRGKFRLARVDAPETALRRGVTKEEKTAGLSLKDRLRAAYPPTTEVLVSTTKQGKYGRYIVEVYTSTPFDSSLPTSIDGYYNLSDSLLALGLAEEY